MITENGMKIDYYEVPVRYKTGLVNVVVLEVMNEPPEHLECPEIWENEAKLHRIFIIDSNEVDYEYWSGCRVHWNNKDWILTSIVAVENGKRFLIELESLKFRKMKMLVK